MNLPMQLNLKGYLTRCIFLLTVCILAVLFISGKHIPEPAQTITWKINSTRQIGEFKPEVIGKPVVIKDKTGSTVAFNGINDGLVVPTIPITGWTRFTIEVLFKPDVDGPSAPRFMHFEDADGNRGTFELRITPMGEWYLDAFLKNGKLNKGLTLIDSTILHPAGKWYWAAMVYDGRKMTSYVNGQKELEGEVELVPMLVGRLALGVRLNKVNWFKGQLKEIRFHPAALDQMALQGW
ncbi:LamG domain-containing protein [Segetibacter sp. 3557_3]|uniref:LamG domain-containing protein n=1 Tax=Segetibacter sp. 3557_3 TaxID=2547429 RepID=UPI00105878C3|nr:LamG domain-containing protein [Segetibacter sp. 3557_3]TDH21624.1 LamG domain-containing protein [Segetibacter sp. 3557_3]